MWYRRFFSQDRAIVVPFIDGQGCEQLVKRRGPLSKEMFLTILRTVVDSLESGPHVITVVHPDFPIVEEGLRLESDTMVVYDLDDRFADVESVNFQIGVSPRLTDAMLRVGFNGHTTDYERVPIRASEKLLGRWQVAFEIVPNSAASAPMQVDSFLVRPGPTGERELVRGDRATLDFGAISWMGRRLSRVVVYWSEQ